MVQDIVKNTVQVCETATGAKESQNDLVQLLALCHDPSSLPRATVATEGVWRAVCGCYREGQCHLLSSLQRVNAIQVHACANVIIFLSGTCVG